MSDFRPIQTPRARGLSARAVALIVVIAFVAGLAIAIYASRRVSWLAPPTTVATAPTQKPAAAPAPAQPDPAALSTREAVLAGQIAALEARTAAITVDAQAAGMQAGRAEALLVAFAARRAIDRGLGLGYLEGQLRARFAAREPRAVTTVVEAARQPLTLGDLREGLATIGPDIASGARLGWAEGVRRELGNLIVLRRDGTPSPLPEDRLARARRLLEGGQVEAARAEVARLPGAAEATNWMQAASRYVATRHALDTLESAALRTPPPLAPPSGPLPAPAPVAPAQPTYP